MSKHNDIYNILGKLAGLEPKQKPAPTKEKVYESVDPRGSVTEGVRAVEQQLSEKYMGFKKTVAAIKKGGSAENPEAVAAAIGRKKYGKAAFQKAAAAGKKMGEAEELVTPEKREQYRNLAKQLKKSGADATTAFQKGGEELGIFKKDEQPVKENGLQYYTGKKKYGKDGMAALAKAGRDGASQEELGRIKDKFIKKESEGELEEVAAPGQEDWIKKNKKRFIDQYGKEKGLSVLYATAWKRAKKDEDIASMGIGSGGSMGVIGEDPMSASDDSAATYTENQERPYVCVHAKKGKCQVTANSSYEAAKKAAKKWKLKNTAGIDAHLADTTHKTSELGEGETTYTKTGRIHKGTYGTEYQGDGDDEESVDSRGRGRPRVHAKKAEPTEKKGRGRPKKADTGEKHSSEHMPWGSYEKSGMKKGAHHKLPHWAKGRTTTHKIDESINLKKMMEEQHMTLEEMLECLDTDMRMFKETGHMSPLLRDCMDMFSANRKQIADEAATDISHPDAPAYLRKQKGAPLSLKDIEQHQTSHPSHPDFEWPEHAQDTRDVTVNKVKTPFDEELNELARLAGLSVDEEMADEGAGVMHYKAEKAKQAGKDSFKLGDKTFPVDEEIADEGNEFSGALAKARAQGKKEFDVDGKEYPVKEALAKDEDSYGDPEFDDESEEVVNKPKKQYYSMRASSLNPGEGDSGEKTMNPDRPTFKNGDNPLSKPPVRESESENRFKGRLAQEYESIKKSK